jgi:hypothetical protein
MPMELLERRIMDVPSYISGFTEGEGCFCISFNRRKKLNVGIEVRPSFSISQNEKNLRLIEEVHKFFDCGGIRYCRNDRNYKFETRNIQDINEKIIPHFQRYPLLGAKKEDFEKFAEVCQMIKSNLHLSKDGLKKIIDLSYQINYSKRKYEKEKLLKYMTR